MGWWNNHQLEIVQRYFNPNISIDRLYPENFSPKRHVNCFPSTAKCITMDFHDQFTPHVGEFSGLKSTQRLPFSMRFRLYSLEVGELWIPLDPKTHTKWRVVSPKIWVVDVVACGCRFQSMMYNSAVKNSRWNPQKWCFRNSVACMKYQ